MQALWASNLGLIPLKCVCLPLGALVSLGSGTLPCSRNVTTASGLQQCACSLDVLLRSVAELPGKATKARAIFLSTQLK